MNRFSDLQAIKQSLYIRLEIEAIVANGSPEVIIKHNDSILFNGRIDKGIILTTNQEDILEPFQISVTLFNKQYDARKETAAIVKSLSVDEIELIPDYSHLFNYQNDHNNMDPTSYLGFNGTWSLNTVEPFYNWLHRVSGQGWLLE